MMNELMTSRETERGRGREGGGGRGEGGTVNSYNVCPHSKALPCSLTDQQHYVI